MRAVIYARVSTDRQEEDRTIESQLDAIHHHPTTSGKEIVEVYADDGVSGYTKPLWHRPGGAKLLAAAESGSLQGVELLLTRLNRLGRRAREIDEAIDRLMAAGVTIFAVKEGHRFDNQTPMGKFTRQLFASLAELDRNTIVDTTRDGMVRKARQGILMPAYARLGYDWTEVDASGHKKPGAHLIVNEEEAALVRLIFEKYPTMTNKQLVLWLNEHGHRRPCKSPRLRRKYQRETRLFDAKMLSDIIKDELYTGMMSWGKTTRDSSSNRAEEFRHHLPELQIVRFEAFNRANVVMRERRQVPSRTQGSPYIFSGLVRCPKCGGRTVGKRQWHPEYDYQETRRYECRAYHTMGKTACAGWNAFEQTVKKAVIAFLVDLLDNKLQWRACLEAAAQELQREQTGGRAQALQAEVAQAQHELSKVQEGFVLGIFTGDESRQRALNARERIEKAERTLGGLKAAGKTREEITSAIRLLEMPLQEFLEGLPADALAQLCRAVFQHFTIRASGVAQRRTAEIEAYELTPMVKQALVDSVHNVPVTPALEMV
jgi:site-specific DNA recombinase